ncbi:MAG TPA: YfhO family protein [Thermoanaerobaculia bacterium]|nr:YfhO family protein [Thermoanaerobaculia bacterium]
MSETRRTFAAALLVGTLAWILYAIHPAFFVRDDFQLQYLPGSREVARAWMSGEFPLLSRYSWLCAGLGAEYQFAVFSVFRALLDIIVWLLPLSLTARGALMFIVHAAIAAAGAYRLARDYGASVGASFMVAVVAGLNGWILWWGTTWFPGVAAFAWLPWYWLGLRRKSFLLTAVSLYLLVTAGWPYAVLMAFAVGFLALLRKQWRVVGASAVGLGLSAPAVLMLLEYFPYTARDHSATLVESIWSVPPAGLFGLVIPAFAATWKVFDGAMPHPAVELLGAFVPLAALLAGARRDFVRRHVPELALLMMLVVLMLLPSAGPFRWSFRWLPLFHLVLAICGAAAFRPPAGGLKPAAPRFALGLVLVTAVAAIAFDLEPQATLLHAGIVAALCIIWLFVDNEWMPVAITIAMVLLTFATFSRRSEVPVWSYDESLQTAGVLDPARRYLAMYDVDSIVARDAYGRRSRGVNAELRPGNVPMLARLKFINGYSPLGLAAMRNIFAVDAHGPMGAARAELLLREQSAPDQLLHQFGIDGLIVPEAMATKHAQTLARNGWTLSARIASSLVLHRQRIHSPVFKGRFALKTLDERTAYAVTFGRGIVLYTSGDSRVNRYDTRDLRSIEEHRNSTVVGFEDKGGKTLLVFRRAWLPGWRATIDGKPVPVLRANMVLPAVEVPPDHFEVRLYYRPTSLVVGSIIAALSLVVLVVVVAKT